MSMCGRQGNSQKECVFLTADLFSVKDVTDVPRNHEAALLFRCLNKMERHLGSYVRSVRGCSGFACRSRRDAVPRRAGPVLGMKR